MPSDWNAGKSCSADHRSWWALDSHTVTTWSPLESVPAVFILRRVGGRRGGGAGPGPGAGRQWW
jgi:hypothetical protein